MKYFPAELELKLLITDGESFGVATIGLGHGESPSNSEIQERIQKFEREELSSKRLEGYRLASGPEYWDYVCTEKSGQTFACPAEWREFHIA